MLFSQGKKVLNPAYFVALSDFRLGVKFILKAVIFWEIERIPIYLDFSSTTAFSSY